LFDYVGNHYLRCRLVVRCRMGENGFEVAVVGDATASAKLPGLDGNQAAQTNYKMISSRVFTTKELVKELKMHDMK